MNFDFGDILTRAFRLTWKHKSFWLFMAFPMLVAAFIFLAFVAPVFFLEGNEDMLGLVMAVWIGVVALGVIAIFLASSAGLTSLTLGILRAERGEGSTAFMDLVRDGIPYFWRVLGVIVLIQMTVGLVFSAFFMCAAGLIAVTAGVAAICLMPVMILITPLSYLLTAALNAGIVAVIEEDLGSWDAVKRSLQVIRDHVWKFVLLMLIVYLGTSLLSGIFVVPAMIPSLFAPVAAEMDEQAFWLVMGSFVCLFFPAMALYTGIVGAFTTSVVDIAYLRLSRPVENIIYSEKQ